MGGGKLSETCRNGILGPGSRENFFSAWLSFTTVLSFFQEEVMEQLVMKSPPEPRHLTPLASQ